MVAELRSNSVKYHRAGSLLWLLLLVGCGVGTAIEPRGSVVHGAIRDEHAGFYLQPEDDFGLRWVMFCDDAKQEDPAQWSECREVSILDPVLADASAEQMVLEQLIALPLLEGTIPLQDLQQQMADHMQQLTTLQARQDLAQKTATTAGVGVLVQLGITKLLDASDVNMMQRRGYALQKLKLAGGRTINILPPVLSNLHLRYFLAMISRTKLARSIMVALAVVGAGAYGFSRQQLQQQLRQPKLADTDVPLYDLARAFLLDHAEVVAVDDAAQTLTTLLLGLDLSADMMIMLRLHDQAAAPDEQSHHQTSNDQSENQAAAVAE